MGGGGGLSRDRYDASTERFFFPSLLFSHLAVSHNSVSLSCSTIVMLKQVGQQQAKHMIRRQARGGVRLVLIIFYVFNLLAFIRP